MLKPWVRKTAIFSILLYIFLVKTDYTDADIFAERIVSQNKLSAITLDFSTRTSFNNSRITNLFSSLGFQPGGFDLGAVRIKNESSRQLKYRLRAVKTNGDDFFCDNLKVRVYNHNFFQVFNGSLTSLSIQSNLGQDDLRDYIFFISLDDQDQALKNRICEFNFDIRTYWEHPDEQGGVFAQRLIGNVVSSGSW